METGSVVPNQLDPDRLTELLTHVWPGVSGAEVQLEQISHHDHADHWLAIHHDSRFVLRVAHSFAAARRVISALDALDGASYAPHLLATSVSDVQSDQFIGMEYIEGAAPQPADVQLDLDTFINIIRDIHRNDAFRVAVESVGRAKDADSSRRWAEDEWERLQTVAPLDERVRRAAEWMAAVRTSDDHTSEAEQIMVHGHGDLHAGNWRMADDRVVLLDWEEIRYWPLASELADFVVFGDLDPADVASRYGAPPTYGRAVRREAAACALSFYLYWLRALIDRSDPRPESFAQVTATCERLFADN